MAKNRRQSRISAQKAANTEIQQFTRDMADDWRRHRWSSVTWIVACLTYFLYRMITEEIMPRLPFTPQFKIIHDFTTIYKQISLGTQPPLLQQFILWNNVTEYGIIFAAGLIVGYLLTNKATLAAFLAVLPCWIMSNVSNQSALRAMISMHSLPRGGENLSLSQAIPGILLSTPMLATAIIGSLLGQYRQRMKSRRNTT